MGRVLVPSRADIAAPLWPPASGWHTGPHRDEADCRPKRRHGRPAANPGRPARPQGALLPQPVRAKSLSARCRGTSREWLGARPAGPNSEEAAWGTCPFLHHRVGHPNGRHPPRPRASTSQRLQLRHGSVMRVRCRIPPDRSRVESSHDPALGRAAAILLGPCGLLPISRSATTRLKSLLFYSSRYNALAQELASWSGIVGTWRSALCRAAWNAMAVWLSRNRIAILSCGLNGVSTRSILIFIPSPARNKHHHRMRLDSIGWS